MPVLAFRQETILATKQGSIWIKPERLWQRTWRDFTRSTELRVTLEQILVNTFHWLF